jgi:hypothetical protein
VVDTNVYLRLPIIAVLLPTVAAVITNDDVVILRITEM